MLRLRQYELEPDAMPRGAKRCEKRTTRSAVLDGPQIHAHDVLPRLLSTLRARAVTCTEPRHTVYKG